MSSESEAAKDKPMDPEWLPLSVREAIRKGDPGPVGEFVGRFRSALATERKARSEAEAEAEKLRNILHDADTTPLSSVASEMAALRENADGVVALLAEAEAERDALKAERDEWKKRAAVLDGASSIHAHCRAEIEKWERRANESRVQTLNRIGDEIATLKAEREQYRYGLALEVVRVLAGEQIGVVWPLELARAVERIQADLKRKEEALREARGRIHLGHTAPAAGACDDWYCRTLSAALSPSPEGRSEERRHRFEARDDSSAGNCAACGEEWAATVHSPAPAQSEAEDVQHLRNPDGSCVVSLGGQGHMPCGVHAPAKAESPARCACPPGFGYVCPICLAPTTPEPQEAERDALKAQETAESQRNELADALASCRAERDALKAERDEWKKRAAVLDGASSIHAHCRAESAKWEKRANEGRVHALNGIGDEIATLRADLKRKEEALEWALAAFEEARKDGLLGGDGGDAASEEYERNLAPIRAALSPSPQPSEPEPHYETWTPNDGTPPPFVLIRGQPSPAPAPTQSENEDVQRLRNPDGSCVVSLGGQGHMPCGVHAPAKAESPARCACPPGFGYVCPICLAPTTPEPQEAERDALKAQETAESQRNELADALASCRAERDALKKRVPEAATLRADLKRKEEALAAINGCITYSDTMAQWVLPGAERTRPALALVRAALSPSPEADGTAEMRQWSSAWPKPTSPEGRSAPKEGYEAGLVAGRDYALEEAARKLGHELFSAAGYDGWAPVRRAAIEIVRALKSTPAPAKAESPARCAGTIEMMGSGLTRCHLPAGHESDRDHESEIGCWPTTPERPARCDMPNYLGDRCIKPHGHGSFHQFDPTTPEPQEGK